MEEYSNPSPIKEYYIAYFDILGYRQFFKDQPEKAESFLKEVHSAIANTKHELSSLGNNSFLKDIVKVEVDFKVKIFSDNIFICLERGNDTVYEKPKALLLLYFVSKIQRNFILVHSLFLRGCVTIGKISFNDDYIFGTGLIEAVEKEETTFYPRVAVSESYYKYFNDFSLFTKEEFVNARNIEIKIQGGETISPKDEEFCTHIQTLYQFERLLSKVFCNLTFKDYDNNIYISYLYLINPMDYPETFSNILDSLKQILPDMSEAAYSSLSNVPSEIDDILNKHKLLIEEQIKKYGDYTNIKSSNDEEATQHKKAIQQERILKNMFGL